MEFPKVIKQFLHPAILKLTWFQITGKLRRFASAFRSRRKVWLSILAIGLGVIWLSQTVLAILFRQPADPTSLRSWLSVSLLLYSLFHMIKIGCRKPVEPFEWTAAEKQWLLAGPVKRSQLVTARLLSYLAATAAKSICFAVVMLPDLKMIVAGYVGMFIGLALVDLIRMLLEQAAWTASKTSKLCWLFVRGAMVLPVLGLLGYAIGCMAWSPAFEAASQSPNPMAIPKLFLSNVGDIVSSPLFSWVMIPWTAAADTILSLQVDFTFYLRLGLLYLLVSGLSAAVYLADRTSYNWLRKLELRNGHASGDGTERAAATSKKRKLTVPTGFGGAKAIVWHHVLGAIHYRSSLAMSLLIPTVLSCLPLMTGAQTTVTTLSVLGSIVFYSFLLLPPALMLDFRRDAGRLKLWKASPVQPVAMTIGQLFVPVALMSLFQIAVVGITVFVCGHPWQMLLALPVFVPLNVLIVAVENAIFLAHPYRRNQEGFEVFLRTILTFTGKGVLFAIGLVMVLVWFWLAIWLGEMLLYPGMSSVLFLLGMVVALSSLAWFSIRICSKLFENLDVSFDLPSA